MFWRAVSVALLLLATGCDEVTQIVVETETDYVPGVEVSRIEWELRSTSDTPFEPMPFVELAAGDEGRFPLLLTAVPEGALDAPLSVVARAYAPDGSLLVMQERSTSFTPDVSGVLRIELSRLCAAETCDPGETCAPVAADGRGACVSPGVLGSSLPAFREGRPTGVQELCNGRDDDGDDVVDNGFDFGADTGHCGGCFVACEAGPFARAVCTEGVCGYECETLRANCNDDSSDGCEANLGEAGNCGECDVSCAPPMDICSAEVDASMVSASCVSACPSGRVPCGDGDARGCVDTSTDVAHCGGCGMACQSPGLFGDVRCSGGECVVDCDPGFHECGSTCVASDSVTSCGTRCAPCDASGANVADVRCSEAQCVLECADGFTDCDGDPANGCEVERRGDDPLNCGGCGIDCGYGECADGECSNRVVDYSVGPEHSCARLADHSIWCWGNNDAGQLGLPTSTTSSSTPVQIPIDGLIALFNIGPLDDDTTYVTYGLPVFDIVTNWQLYALGRDPRSDSAVLTEPTMVFSTPYGPVAQAGGGAMLIAGANRLAGSDADFSLWGVGDPSGDAFSIWAPPELATWMGDRNDPVGVARGDHESCANYAAPGLLRCWGTAAPSQPVYVGDGTTDGSSSPVVLRPDGLFLAAGQGRLDAGFGIVCAPFAESPGSGAAKYYCWGDWSCGDLDSLVPEPLPGSFVSAAIPDLRVGRRAACGIETATGRLHCWGDDMLGGACHEDPTQPFPNLQDAVSVGLGRRHGCVLRRGGASDGGALYCWGSNDVGQLGADPVSGPGLRQVVFDTPPATP